jgi:hypothetical protein
MRPYLGGERFVTCLAQSSSQISSTATPLRTTPQEDEATATPIASVPGWTNSRECSKFPEQTSAAQSLVAGDYYRLQALAKEATGGDNLAVGARLPDGADLSPIPVEGYLFPSDGGR